ncbi:NAD-dependent succinate-semialdehyde dehydrogenase [Micromonospora sp. NBC_00858]|uniref:NAD-dependent succinate-semialdehyde dehydrogenase n=1 Tax=Micromonospora sp. NBC_00858 TaxID=2975979 RepID=UPI0038646410|nr:NAD-dependent succinate-semialdehyde dehydrogenase [Micromonospora sp. NBC_00858]
MPTTLSADELIASVPKHLLIGGRWVAGATRRTLAVDDPATGTVLCEIADADVEDGRQALDAAFEAQDGWADTPARERSDILRRAYEIILSRTEDLALLMTLEMGKPLAEARGEVAYAAEFFRWFSEEAVRVDGGFSRTPDGRNRILVMRQPVGPCLLITPWNFPLAMGTRKIGPAIAAGCTMVLKPAPQTPLSSLALARILQEAGLPDGVLQVITTSRPGDVVAPLLRSGQIRKLSFTGSTQVGRVLLAQCAEAVVRTSMELGGNAPFIVFPDADLDLAVEGAMTAKMRNMGEACTAANRLFVHRRIADEFGWRLAARMRSLRVGAGTADDTDVGPLIDEASRRKISALVNDAVSRGARVLTGGTAIEGPGYFYSPTVLTEVDLSSEMLKTEIFGPVAPIVAFDDEAEIVRTANATDWGLVGYVFTRDIDRALRLCERLDVGMVGLNTGLVSTPAAPFGGVKQSGLGREGGRVGIEEFLEYKYVAIPVRG